MLPCDIWADDVSQENLLQCYEYYEHDGYILMVLEPMLHSLDYLLRNSSECMKAAPTRRACAFQLLNGLAYLHDRSVIHRDMKPENVLIRRKAPHVELVIADFGLSHSRNTLDTRRRVLAGTPGWIPPELIGLRLKRDGHTIDPVIRPPEQYSSRGDIWACGRVIEAMRAVLPVAKVTFTEILRAPAAAIEDYQPLVSRLAGLDAAEQGEETELIKAMLEFRSAIRPSARDCLQRSWLRDARTTDNRPPLVSGSLYDPSKLDDQQTMNRRISIHRLGLGKAPDMDQGLGNSNQPTRSAKGSK